MLRLSLKSAIVLFAVLAGAIALQALAGGSDRLVSRTRLLGDSARGRLIKLFERGDPDTGPKVLVVGCIHGNEPAGIAIAEQLESQPLPREADLWVVDDANPDGVAAGTRTNGRGVDLNRNFPWRWSRRGRRGDSHYSGPRALSEPESRMLAALIRRVRPAITIWFHQPLGIVDESGGGIAVEQRYASLVGLPLRRLPRYPGGVTDWQNASFAGTTAFVVELPPGALSPSAVRRFAQAAVALATP